ncbi:CU044_2847 family protein [Micromonospora sp. WMMD1128]|uniref:CU044_2847 family protein n=1 Tax=Micromonospora sp. WMMD1128 TaxID=3015150 RepID=UPI00248CEDEF|nr:CU044_2847 family protein [Micromonospora sp. WMMD1128]WBB71263.1 CU044_2847 family protein [Micromonospora sp. WMMD1128]
MTELVRIPLDDGGTLLVEGTDTPDGPVDAGRIGDHLRELPATLRTTLRPVADAAQVVLEQLRRAGPDEIEAEFGVNLSNEAGAVITKSQLACHLKVTVRWRRAGSVSDPER